MIDEISILKGIHPGFVLERKLKARNLRKRPFALSIDEHPQTLSAITKGKRSINTALALKIENALGLEEGYLMTLQVFYDIKEEKRKQQQHSHPDLSLIRPAIFWDTDIKSIEWQTHRRAVIERVLDRGNDQENAEIKRFYGDAVFNAIADKLKQAQHLNLGYKSAVKKMIKPILYHSFEEKEQIERDLFATMPTGKRKALAVELMSIFHTPVEAKKRKTSKKPSAKG